MSKLIKIFFMIIFINCHGQNGNINRYDPNLLLANELMNGKIILLADYQHHTLSSNRSLIDLIYSFIKITESKKASTKKLTLILEKNNEEISNLQRFIDHGKINSLINEENLQLSLEDIAFYNYLRSLILATRNDKRQKGILYINIKGFERTNKQLREKCSSEKNKLLWFVKDRDRDLADSISNYIDHNVDEKIIIFYGGAHLIASENIRKSNSPLLNTTESTGNFLAYYLKRKYSENKILTVNQIVNNDKLFLDMKPEPFLNDKYIVDCTDSVCKRINIERYDKLIIRNEPTPIYHELRFCHTNFIIDKLLLQWKKMESESKSGNTFSYNAIGIIQNTFHYLVDTNFIDYLDAKRWADSKSFKGLERLDTQEYARFLYQDFLKNLNSFSYRLQIVSIGFGPAFLNIGYSPTPNEWNKDIWPKLIKHIKFFNSLGCYWFGYPSEKKKAIKFLINFTDNNFNDPIQYLEWWYKKFYNYSS